MVSRFVLINSDGSNKIPGGAKLRGKNVFTISAITVSFLRFSKQQEYLLFKTTIQIVY